MTPTAANTLRLERTFDASSEQLWAAWTDPAQYAKWLNPAPGLDLVVHEWDLRPGGRIRFDMPQPDGNPNPQEGVFHELDPPRRLVTGSEDRSFLIVARFEPQGQRTRLVVEVTGVPPDWHAAATKGWSQGFDKLASLLAARARTRVTADGRDFAMERILEAPRERVFATFTDPATIPRWWGPARLVTTVEHMEPRWGGRWRFVQRDTDGSVYAFRGVYHEVTAPGRVVQTMEFEGEPGHVLLETATFEDLGGRTRMVLRSVFPSAEMARAWAEHGAEAGARELVNRLAALVEQPQDAAVPPDREIVLTREVDAPPERVWAAWTDREQVRRWFGPDGFRVTTTEMDVRPGGVWRFTMHGPDGTDYPNWVRYQEVVPPRRLAYAHGGSKPDEPDFHAIVTFEDLGGRTRLTLRSVFPSREARDYVVREHHAIEGGKQTLARLAEHLAK